MDTKKCMSCGNKFNWENCLHCSYNNRGCDDGKIYELVSDILRMKGKIRQYATDEDAKKIEDLSLRISKVIQEYCEGITDGD